MAMENNPMDVLGRLGEKGSEEKELLEALKKVQEEDPTDDYTVGMFIKRMRQVNYEDIFSHTVGWEMAISEMQMTGLLPTESLNAFLALVTEYQYRARQMSIDILDTAIDEEDKKWREANPEKAAKIDKAREDAAAQKEAMMEALLGGNGGGLENVGDLLTGAGLGDLQAAFESELEEKENEEE